MEPAALKQNTTMLFFCIAFLVMNMGKSLEMEMHGTAKFHLTNNCGFKVWPAIVAEPGNNINEPSSSGFELGPAGDSKNVFVPALWSGRVWGRTGCAQDPAHGMLFWCMTGDCGSSTVECAATAGNITRETTVATVKLRGSGAYDINITTQDYLPMTAGKSKEGQYEFHFCHPSSSRGDGSIRVNPHSDSIVTEFLLGVLSSMVAAALIALFNYYRFQNTTEPSENA